MMEPPSIDSTLTPSLFPDLAYDQEEDDDDDDDDDESYQEESSSEETSEDDDDTNNYTNATSHDYDVSREDHGPEEETTYLEERSASFSNNNNDDYDEKQSFGVTRPAMTPETAVTPQKSNSNYRYSVVGGMFGCCYSYTGFAIIFFGVVIVGSVLIKMAMDNGGESTPSIPSPTSAPNNGTVISIPTSPTEDLFCQEEHSRFDSCLASLGNSQSACAACFSDAKETTEIAASCDRINYQLCTAVTEKCPASCKTCASQFEEWNACFFKETGTCEVDCATAPQKEPEAVCETQIIQYRSCLEGVGPEAAEACVDCVNNAIVKADEQVMCSAFHSDFCTAFEKCTECGGCMDQMEEWMHCMTVNFNKCNAGIDCDKPKEPCDDEMVSYHSCLGTFGPGERLESCLGCVRDSFETALEVDSSLCNDIQDSFCVGFDTCDDCGGSGSNGCRDQAETYVSCLVTTNGCSSGVDCERDPDPCGSEINGYQACLAEIGNQDNVTECRNCVNTAVETHLSAECDTFNDGFCADFQLCDTCKPCATKLNSFVTCRMLNTWNCSTGLKCTQT